MLHRIGLIATLLAALGAAFGVSATAAQAAAVQPQSATTRYVGPRVSSRWTWKIVLASSWSFAPRSSGVSVRQPSGGRDVLVAFSNVCRAAVL